MPSVVAPHSDMKKGHRNSGKVCQCHRGSSQVQRHSAHTDPSQPLPNSTTRVMGPQGQGRRRSLKEEEVSGRWRVTTT